ncbi:hypothetical protein CANARDRAFT_224674 [[Candida] arabinofermentans NRRL YB-2248]|uniref:DNA mismatch repair protein PMS1 n=1 Tax=[Candida] arabinofermentans NRRL YB-2248 TaxID=983967 RepID=A0A1E4SX66_9ASCO|nr:hypothetical protein CANARDRAFT_224674 [[Candida] arabinofermentans NRRL YB-2248]
MSIQAIDVSDVHRITSGQVIIDLSTAVKEVLENSIDAHATQITVTFKNYGLDLIEVTDNGSGIEQSDFEKICLKHYTSKLEKFEDVADVRTLGFRGEAMSSLCAIADVSIRTATKDMKPKAYLLDYDDMGRLSKTEVCSGQTGTMVQISNLFKNLPVRRIDLQKNSKREFQKLLTFLQSYAIISLGVRILVQHELPGRTGKKSILLSSTGSKHLKNNILNVFGSNGMYGLEETCIKLDIPLRFKLKGAMDMKITIEGYLSNCSFGQGRSATDRQMWFVNRRPVNLTRFSKAVNEIYKMFNHLQSPVIILNIELDPLFVDVNVTPDKRTVMLHNENLIIEQLKEELNCIFNNQDIRIPLSTVAKDQLDQRNTNFKQLTLVDNFLRGKQADIEPEDEYTSTSFLNDSNFVEIISDTRSEDGEVEESSTSINLGEDDGEYNIAGDLLSEDISEKPESLDDYDESPQTDGCFKSFTSGDSNLENVNAHESPSTGKHLAAAFAFDSYDSDILPSLSRSSANQDSILISIGDGEKSIRSQAIGSKSRLKFSQESDIETEQVLEDHHHCHGHDNQHSNEVSHLQEQRPAKRKLSSWDSSTHNLEITCKLPLQYSKPRRRKEGSWKTLSKEKMDDILDPIAAEKILSLTVSKNDFLNMRVIGQFNLGFILVTRKNEVNNDLNLFIVDQHASDEKFNFERLQAETTFNNQPLVVPTNLELNAIDELAVMNSEAAFVKNGFKIKIDEDQHPGSRIKLTSLPYSKDKTFDVSDFHELLHLIKENDGNASVLRPSKVRAMFAMRACRSSIMVGRYLNHKTMKRLVNNLSGLDKPWNCPHGRPTMRHLMELKDWQSFDEDYYI